MKSNLTNHMLRGSFLRPISSKEITNHCHRGTKGQTTISFRKIINYCHHGNRSQIAAQMENRKYKGYYQADTLSFLLVSLFSSLFVYISTGLSFLKPASCKTTNSRGLTLNDLLLKSDLLHSTDSWFLIRVTPSDLDIDQEVQFLEEVCAIVKLQFCEEAELVEEDGRSVIVPRDPPGRTVKPVLVTLHVHDDMYNRVSVIACNQEDFMDLLAISDKEHSLSSYYALLDPLGNLIAFCHDFKTPELFAKNVCDNMHGNI